MKKKAVTYLAPDVVLVPVSLARRLGICSAMLLQQIHYWCHVHGSMHDGASWIRKSYQQWTEELPFKSSTIRAALKELEAAGLIHTARLGSDGVSRWYRVDYEKLSDVLDSGTLMCQKLTGGDSKSGTSHIKEETILKGAHPSDAQAPPTIIGGTPIPLPEKKLPKTITTAKAILEQHKKNQGKLPDYPPNSLKMAEAIWRTIPQHHDTVKFMGALTLAQRGQLSYTIKSWGPTADRNLKHVISHWISFTKFVEGQRGLKKTPLVPDIGFLQKYRADAASFVELSLALKDAQSQPVQLIAPDESKNDSTPKKPHVKILHKNKPSQEPKQEPQEQKVVETQTQDSAEEAASLEDILSWGKKLNS